MKFRGMIVFYFNIKKKISKVPFKAAQECNQAKRHCTSQSYHLGKNKHTNKKQLTKLDVRER